jgi:aspartate ammonia-lyase
VEGATSLVTALNPYIGYEAATKVALEAFHSGRGVYDLVLEGGLMTKDHRT